MAYYSIQANFSKGELSPLLGSRNDVDFWSASLFECLNFNVLTHGGLRRRSGTRFVASVANSAQAARLLQFKFSETQSYVLVLNNGKVRFLAERGVVGAPYEINHLWASTALNRISYTQFNDVAYFAHKDYPPQKLSRIADTNWTIGNAEFIGGPYLVEDTKGTRIAVSARGSVVPTMTSNTTPSGTVTSRDTPDISSAFAIFDGTNNGVKFGPTDGWVAYAFASGSRIADAYFLSADGPNSNQMIASWQVQGFDGSVWVTLDSRNNERGWSANERRYYEFINVAAFQAYRIQWTSSNGDDTVIGEWGLHERMQSQTPFLITLQVTAAGINGGLGFQPTDVDRSIRLLGSDGRWRDALIKTVVDINNAYIQLGGHALPTFDPINRFQMGAFSQIPGFPGAVTLFNERLMWARTNAEPVTVFGSKQGIFTEYGVSDPLVATDGLKITLISSNMNEIQWLTDDEDLITGSSGQIRSIGPSDKTLSFSATNITQRKGPTSGAANLQPLSIGGISLYAGSGATKMRELVLGDQGRYVAPELSLIGEHFFKSGIVEWAFCERPDPTIYAVMGNGELISVTYDREQRVVGFARHQIAGGFVESVAVIPGVEAGFDDVYLVVRRTINGSSVRYIEVLERPFDGDIDAVEDAFNVDCGLSYSGTAISTVTGLSHLEGETVDVLADGNVVRDLVVTGGQITLPDAAEKISVGLRYKSRAVTLPLAGPQQDGTLFGRRRTVIGASVDVLHSGAIKVGNYGSDNWAPPTYEQILKDGDILFGSPVQLTTGSVRCEIEGSWAEGDGKLVMETEYPLPLLIRSLMLQTEGEP